MLGHVVELDYNSGLNFNLYRAVLPADKVLLYLKDFRPSNSWNSSFQEEQYKEAVKFLKDLGRAMVSIRQFGMVCGEYFISPYLISEEQLMFLAKYNLV